MKNKPKLSKEQIYTTHDIARFCKVYPTTVINWINEGLLLAFTTPGGHRRVKGEEVIKLLKKNNMPIPHELSADGKTKILIIDDDHKICKMIKTILESEKNFEISIANSGFESGIVVSEWKPDLILLDFLMPDVDGFEVCRRLRQNEKTKNIPVIAVTVLRDQGEIKKMYKCGVTDYLSKPFKSQALVEKVNKYIHKAIERN